MVNGGVKHRLDIEGLRGIAVAMVVLFHAGVPGTSFGFWGVDMFLVISGFLITTTIVKDIDAGQFRYGDFLARRIRRLMPAATVVILATMLGVFAVGSPLDWAGVGRDAMVGAGYLTNVYAAFVGVSYFNEGASFQPLIHLWSLGLEEQFYVVWPLILVVAARLFGRRGIMWVMALTILVSLGLSVVLSPIAPIKAFYLLPTRMWEFAAGGILGLMTFNPSRARATAFVFVAAGLFVTAVIMLTPQTPLPGALTIAPVVFTALVILSGKNGGQHGFSWLLENPALRFIGRISYSLYLWHWPLLILARPYVGDSAAATIGLIAGMTTLAWLSLTLVETPVRFAKRLQRGPLRSYALAAILVLCVASPGMMLRSAKMPPEIRALAQIRTDKASYEGCADTPCVIKLGSAGRVLVVGDSHAMEWIPAIEEALADSNVDLLFSGRSSCPAVPVRISKPGLRGAGFPSCDAWQDALPALIERIAPDVVIIADFEGYLEGGFRQEASPDERAAIWGSATSTMVRNIQDVGATPVIVLDHRRLQEDPIRCVSNRFANEKACESPQATSPEQLASRHLVHELSAQTGALIVDTMDVGTDDRGDTFRDRHHVSRTYSRNNADRFGPVVRHFTGTEPSTGPAAPPPSD